MGQAQPSAAPVEIFRFSLRGSVTSSQGMVPGKGSQAGDLRVCGYETGAHGTYLKLEPT